MFTHALVCADERHCPADALVLARRLVAPFSGLTLAQVISTSRVPHLSADPVTYERERVRAEAVVHNVARTHSVDSIAVCGGGSLEEGLRSLVVERNADLLVVAAASELNVSALLRPDMAEEELSCPLAIAPVRYAETHGPIRDVAVEYDAGPAAARALAFARLISDVSGGEVRLLVPRQEGLDPWLSDLDQPPDLLVLTSDLAEAPDRTNWHFRPGPWPVRADCAQLIVPSRCAAPVGRGTPVSRHSALAQA